MRSLHIAGDPEDRLGMTVTLTARDSVRPATPGEPDEVNVILCFFLIAGPAPAPNL